MKIIIPAGKTANNLVYGSLLTLGYFLASPGIKDSLTNGLVRGGTGFLILVVCHMYSQFVTQSGEWDRRKIVLFAAAELALLAPFIVAAVVGLVALFFSGSDDFALGSCLAATLAIVWIVTFGTARRAGNGLRRSHLFAAGATAVGIVLAIVRILN